LARGIVILRSRRALGPDDQAALIGVLADVGMTEAPDEDRSTPARTLIAAPWAPPRRDELPACVAAVESLAERFDVDAAWFYKVETAIDGVAWAELVADAAAAA